MIGSENFPDLEGPRKMSRPTVATANTHHIPAVWDEQVKKKGKELQKMQTQGPVSGGICRPAVDYKLDRIYNVQLKRICSK